MLQLRDQVKRLRHVIFCIPAPLLPPYADPHLLIWLKIASLAGLDWLTVWAGLGWRCKGQWKVLTGCGTASDLYKLRS